MLQRGMPPAGFATLPPLLPQRRVERGRRPPRGIVVVYRKGELSKGTMDRQWPHQVALPAWRCTGANYVTIHLFCEGLTLCPRTHSFRTNDTDMLVFCFADRAHADQFQAHFGGAIIDPKQRPRWPGSRR
jgi:hypothetical protein